MARECKNAMFFAASCPHRIRFRSFVGQLERLFGVSLACPTLTGSYVERLSSFKRFCSAPLERRSHLWDMSLQSSHLGRDSVMSIHMSLFLFRKTLPSSPPDPMAFLDRISSPSPEPCPLFMEFVRQEMPRLFKHGWDRGYSAAALNTVLPLKSCVERGRGKGGCRSWFMDNKSLYDGREAFVETLLTTEDCPELRPSRLSAIPTAGKLRLISVPPFEMNLLRPLHTVIYNHISREKWCLRGDAKPARFADFVFREGELFVSGDYESATDNLNLHVQKEILRHVLQSACHVPNGIRRLAMNSLSTSLQLCSDLKPVRTELVQNGQMMGYLLSFPLLCIVNYLAFRYALGRDVPVRINGDDIVFRSTQSEYDRWSKFVGSAGLTLSVGKTLVDRRYFTLNSTLFKSSGSSCRIVPIIRSTAVFGELERSKESILSLPGRFRSFCPGFSGKRRSSLRVWWLKTNRGLIDASRRSLTRGLGLPLRFDQIAESGLWAREGWYLSFESEKALPSPLSEWSRLPEGFTYRRVEKVTKEQREEQKEVAVAFVNSAWEPSLVVDTSSWEWDLVSGNPDWGGWAYQRSSGLRRRARLLGLSPRNAVRFLQPVRSLLDRFKPRRLRPIWTRVSSGMSICFQSGE